MNGPIMKIFHCRSSSSGEGIFTFFAPRAREIVNALELATKSAQRQPLSAVEGKKAGKMNPLLAFLRRGSTPTSPSLTRLLFTLLKCGQSYRPSTIVIYDSRVIPDY